MKTRSSVICLRAALAAGIALPTLLNAQTAATAAKLSPEQIAAIQEQLGQLRATVEGRFSEMNRSAGDVFRQAAQDPKAAVELYAKCYREVHFVREGREDEYRDWEDSQKDTFKDPRFIEGILVQLRYLALSCEAAEAEKLETVFPALLTYVDSLTALSDVPSQQLLQGVNQSVFAQAYQLDELLARNREWEMVPFNIPGIYEKTVMPHLRRNDPSRLMGAWDKRIAHQTQMAQFIANLEEKGNNRDDRRAAENRARQVGDGRGGNVIRQYDENEFKQVTLPNLQWNRLKDMALYVDQVQGVAGLLAFLREQTQNVKVADWLDEMESLLPQLGSGAPAAPPAEPAPVAAPPVGSIPAATPAAPAGPPTVGGVPRGLE